MENFSQWAEIVFASSDSAVSQAIGRAVKKGQLRKLAPRIYSSNFDDTPEIIVQRHQFHILSQLFPGAIISHRSAIEGGIADNTIFLTYLYTKKIVLPGLTIHLLAGPGPLEGDTVFMETLYFSSRARTLLENLQPSRGKYKKCVSRADLEDYINKICHVYGEQQINQLRDHAKVLAKEMDLLKEATVLEKLIATILGTKKAIARSKGVPYDSDRVELFATLVTALLKEPLESVSPPSENEKYKKNFAFFESYFSNFIEGTEFEIDVAANIIFQNKALAKRPEDSHDIISTFQLVADDQKSKQVPNSSEELMTLLKQKHAKLLIARPAMSPGEFKDVENRAGNTCFVKPELVIGTLTKGFELYLSLPQGLARAIFMMFLVSEIHPFNDGNGRIARLSMNVELTKNNHCRIIIPTVYRDDYLLTLRRLSQQSDPLPYINMLIRAQQFSASILCDSYQQAIKQLQQANAFCEPNEGILKFGNEKIKRS